MKGINKKKKRKKGMVVCLFMAIFIIVIIIVFALGCNNTLKIQRYIVKNHKIKAPIKIALVTDLHSCKYGEKEKELISAIESQKPDLILLGGDIYDDVQPDDNSDCLVEWIGSKSDEVPSYYVTGNHEYWRKDVDLVIKKIKEHGIKVLDGQSDTIAINGQNINVCGLSDPDYFAAGEGYLDKNAASLYGTEIQLEKIGESVKKESFTVLLAHRPEFIKKYLEYEFDLILSGHAHGGQWRIPGLINGLIAPGQGLFPDYAGGEYSFDSGSKMIVSRGLARETTRIPRIFNQPELVMVEITP